MEQESLPISEILHALWRRKWAVILTSLILLSIGIFVILKVPTIYRSTGLIVVEQQEIPTQWVNSTVASYADERINAIGQRVLNTENLISIVQKFNLYSDSEGKVPIEILADRAKNNFTVESVQSNVRDRTTGNRGFETVAFRISFDDPSPELARDVTAELVSLYLNENVASRTKAIVDTRQFLESEADRLEKRLADMEDKISKFKERNVGTLPEHQTINLQTFQRIETQIANIDSSLSALAERRIILESGIDSARRYIQAGQETPLAAESPNPLRQRLTQLQAEFAEMQTRYSDVHPDLIKVKREISSIEGRLQTGATGGESQANSTTVASVGAESEDSSLIRLTTDLRSTISEQEGLRIRRGELASRLLDLEEKIGKTPEVEREFRSLVRDHENIQNKYNDIRTQQNSARVSESLELDNKGERFTLIDPPRLPLSPHEPNRKKLGIMALGISLLGGFLAGLGLEKMDTRVRNIRTVEKSAGVPVLVSVGYIENDDDKRKRKSGRIVGVGSVCLIIVAIWAVLNHYNIDLAEITPQRIKETSSELIEKIKPWLMKNG